MKIEFSLHNVGEEEKRKVLECLDGIFLTTGSYVEEFEEKFAGYLKLAKAVGLTSCTAALHLSLLALDIGPGDEVITTPMTFIATANAIIHTGAKPVFVDVEEDTSLLDPDRIETAITERTRAILPVHLYGQMCDMRKIRRIADKHQLKIVEDAAHCIEGTRDGVGVGQLGDVACFSFYATKNITCGEGGAVATNDSELADRILLLRQHGMSKEAAKRYSGHYRHWDMLECGWKCNMDNIQASLLLPQLGRIEHLWAFRKSRYEKYVESLEEVPGVKLPIVPAGSKSAYHLFTVWVDPAKRDALMGALYSAGIGVAVNYRAIHLLKFFRDEFAFRRGMYPNAEKIGDSTISLPFYPKLNDHEIDYVVKTLGDAL